MPEGSDLLSWLIGSVIAWVFWFAVQSIVVDSAGFGIWLLFTVILALVDLLALVGLVRG
jgi:hypothetical protein